MKNNSTNKHFWHVYERFFLLLLSTDFCVFLYKVNFSTRAAEKAHLLRAALTALPEDIVWFPALSLHLITICITSPRDLTTPSGLHRQWMHMVYRHTCKWNTHSTKINTSKKVKFYNNLQFCNKFIDLKYKTVISKKHLLLRLGKIFLSEQILKRW